MVTEGGTARDDASPARSRMAKRGEPHTLHARKSLPGNEKKASAKPKRAATD
jgi:hypothetical protein